MCLLGSFELGVEISKWNNIISLMYRRYTHNIVVIKGFVDVDYATMLIPKILFLGICLHCLELQLVVGQFAICCGLIYYSNIVYCAHRGGEGGTIVEG